MEFDKENNHFIEYDNIIHLFISKKFNKCLTSLKPFVNKSNCIEALNLFFYCLIENKEYTEVNNFIKEHPEVLERNDNFLLKLIAGLNYYYQCKFEDALVILSENKSSSSSENIFYDNFVNKLLIPIRDNLNSGISSTYSAYESINKNDYEEAMKIYLNLLNLDKDNYLISSFIYTKLGECICTLSLGSHKMKSSNEALFYYNKAIEFNYYNIQVKLT
jgi:tetratricopeptide (TPR) repeat protein